jgi:hypothetical protein
MDKARFDDYIRRFNAQDTTAFDDYIAPGLHMLNGTLEFTGRQGMKDHYAKVWSSFRETLAVPRFVSDERTAAIQMRTHFEAVKDDPRSLFGPVREGETFDFQGVIMYEIDGNGQFADITVAYNRFTFTDRGGDQTELGIPH